MASWEYPSHKEFPKVPSLEEVDSGDVPGILDAREQKIREDWVKAMEFRMIRNKLNQCYKTEGVNHHQNCKELSDMYLNLLNDSKVRGWRVLDDNNKKSSN
ncbi:12691_t:CDS:2 [Entrophospora sp. SA101]|nr:1184_t:CDS:2 [Entrophospora candida]CAJ0844868.1 12691_t:CDS:2 [Entrophospora sp. SA101]